MSRSSGSATKAARDDYLLEVKCNLSELKDFVKHIALEDPVQESDNACVYKVVLLEGTLLRVEFVRGRGYFVQEPGKQHFETFQALLSTRSPEYRRVFAERVSRQLAMRANSGS
jgi:hypothetical protein